MRLDPGGSRQAANPLHRPKPRRQDRLLSFRFYWTDEKGKVAGLSPGSLCVGPEYVWLGSEVSIPHAAVETLEIVERKRLLVPRQYLRIVYRNPITGGREQVRLCTFDALGLGFYRREPLERLVRLVEERRPGGPKAPAIVGVDEEPREPRANRCEVCGARPAHYVGYSFLMGAFVMWFHSGVRRRMHCARHNAIHGGFYYLLTALTGWLGVSILGYPLAVWAGGRNLQPAIGKVASYALAVLPSAVLAAILVRWFVR